MAETEAWARWQTAKPSLTKRSAISDQSLAREFEFSFSLGSNLVFSSIKIWPGFNSSAAFLAFSPETSFTKSTFLFNSFDKRLATAWFDNAGSIALGLPKWLRIMTGQFLFKRYLMVGRTDLILVSSAILPDFKGTLQSTLKRTFLFFSFADLMVFSFIFLSK